MENLRLNRKMAQLVLLQRIELANPLLLKLRKIFGRYFFSKIFSKYLINTKEISKNYTKLIEKELLNISSYLKQDQKIMKKFNKTSLTLIEKDYVSDKIKYGWDNENKEGYNDLSLLEDLIIMNNISKDQFKIINYEEGNFPTKKYDLVISFYSLDYHYDFNIYLDYLKKSTDENTLIIFDTIRYEYFNGVFNYVKIIKEDESTVHKSKRIVCRMFK